jgi:hypothetical protein
MLANPWISMLELATSVVAKDFIRASSPGERSSQFLMNLKGGRDSEINAGASGVQPTGVPIASIPQARWINAPALAKAIGSDRVS